MSRICSPFLHSLPYSLQLSSCTTENEICMLWKKVSWDCVVGIVTSFELDDQEFGIRVPVGSRIFSMSSRPALGSTKPPAQWVLRALSPGVKRLGREVGHSHSTSIATCYGLDDWGVWVPSPGMVKNFLFFMLSRLNLGSTQPPILWVLGSLSLGVRWLVHEADHSPPTGAEVKKMWIYTPTPPYTFMV
jgi:hypothetical protein